MEFEIFFADLTNDVQTRLLAAFGIQDPSDANWEVFPVAVIPLPELDDTEE